jgi:hypothetical protein
VAGAGRATGRWRPRAARPPASAPSSRPATSFCAPARLPRDAAARSARARWPTSSRSRRATSARSPPPSPGCCAPRSPTASATEASCSTRRARTAAAC